MRRVNLLAEPVRSYRDPGRKTLSALSPNRLEIHSGRKRYRCMFLPISSVCRSCNTSPRLVTDDDVPDNCNRRIAR